MLKSSVVTNIMDLHRNIHNTPANLPMERLKIRLITDNRRWHSFTPDIQSFWELMVLLINLVVKEVSERLLVSKQEAHKFCMDRNLSS